MTPGARGALSCAGTAPEVPAGSRPPRRGLLSVSVAWRLAASSVGADHTRAPAVGHVRPRSVLPAEGATPTGPGGRSVARLQSSVVCEAAQMFSPALQPEGVACGLAAGLTPCVPSAPGASASPTAPGLGWRPSPAWGTPTAAGECVRARGAGSWHRCLVGVVTVARDHRPGSWANSVRVEGARSGCLPARPHPHCRGSGRSRTLARLGQRSGGVLVRAVSSCRAFLSICAPSHLWRAAWGAAPQP